MFCFSFSLPLNRFHYISEPIVKSPLLIFPFFLLIHLNEISSGFYAHTNTHTLLRSTSSFIKYFNFNWKIKYIATEYYSEYFVKYAIDILQIFLRYIFCKLNEMKKFALNWRGKFCFNIFFYLNIFYCEHITTARETKTEHHKVPHLIGFRYYLNAANTTGFVAFFSLNNDLLVVWHLMKYFWFHPNFEVAFSRERERNA